MTIRQQGGVFGRNPTFNDVDAASITTDNLTSSSVSFTGNSTFDDNAKLIFGDAGDLEIYSTGTTSHIRETGSGDLQISASDDVFIRGTSTNNYMARFRETSSVDLYHNNIRKFQTTTSGISVEGNVKVTDGNGIDFSATSGTGTSELFDDYEEGSYTVSLHDGSSSGNASSTTTTGYYTKVGQVVTCSFAALNNISTAGMTTSNVLYMSLPFSAAQSASGSMAISVVGARQAAGAGYVVPVVVSGNSRARFYGCQSGNATSSIRPAELTSGTSDFINFTMTYIAS